MMRRYKPTEPSASYQGYSGKRVKEFAVCKAYPSSKTFGFEILLVTIKGISLSTATFFHFFSIRCFIPNAYAALFTAALVPLMCLVVVFVVFIHAYQVTPQWKAYDDIFRGRTNAAGMICWLLLCKQVELSEWY